MRLRKLALAVGLASAMGADLASALGLGELKLNSTLNQPLDAEIKLLNVKDLSQDEILVNLATREDFQRAGVDRLYFLTGLKFTIDLANSSGPVVRVTTRKPVNEPYLNFLLQTQWPSGNLLREYTLLMDLPTFADESVRPIGRAETPAPARSAPARREQQPASVTRTTQAAESSRQQPVSSSRAAADNSTSYSVDANDTLWAIALQVRPDRSVSVQQTMLAIQEANPEAFINGNINLLRQGQVLRIPGRTEIVDLSERQAIERVAEQNTAWSGNSSGRVDGAQLDASSRAPSAARESTEVSGRVKLGVDTDSAESGSGAGSDGSRGEALENELAISLEELDKTRRENSDLKSRVSDLESQIETMESLVEVANNELRNLQLAQQESPETLDASVDLTDSSVDVADIGSDEEVADESTAGEIELDGDEQSESLASDFDESESDTDMTGVDETSEFDVAADESSVNVEENDVDIAAKQAAAKAAEKNIADRGKKVVRRAPEKGLTDIVMDNIAYIGAGLLALIGGIWFFLSRRKEDEEEFEDDLEFEADESLAAIDSDEAAESELPLSDADDIVGEADIYLAYDKADEAEQLLLTSLESEPDQIPARLKLLEIYSDTENLSSFDEHYSQLQTLENDDANTQAEELRKKFLGAAPFVAAVPVAASLSDDLDALLGDEATSLDDTAEPESEFDLDLAGDDLDLALDSDSAEGTDFTNEDSDFSDLDFSLGSDESEADAADDLDLDDLDLDLGEDSEPAESISELDDELSASGEDAASDFELDLDDLEMVSEGSEGDTSDLDLPDLDLDLDLDDKALESDSGLDLSLGDDAQESDLAADLDLSLGDDEESGLDLDLSEASDTDLDLDLGLGDDKDSELDLDLSETPDSDLDLDLGDDLDLDLSSDDLELPAEDASDDLDLGLDSLGLESGAADDSSDIQPATDSFDMSFDDDLNSLDSDDELDVEAVADISADTELESLGDLDEVTALDDVESSEAPEFNLDDDLSIDGLDSDLSDADLSALDEGMDDLEGDFGAPLESSDTAEVEASADDASLGLSGLAAVAGNDFSAESLESDESSMDDVDDEFDFLADADEVATKLDLARAYIDMGDSEGAKDILSEVQQEGDDAQKSEADELLGRID